MFGVDAAATVDDDGTTDDVTDCVTLGVMLRRDRRGDECGLCFSVLDIIILLLSACNDDVAMLNSPLSWKFKRFFLFCQWEWDCQKQFIPKHCLVMWK